MRISILTSQYLPYVFGGLENYVELVSSKLTEQGHEVFIITTEPFNGLHSLVPRSYFENIKIYRFYPLNLYHPTNSHSKNIFIKLLWYAIDIINLHSLYEVRKIIKKEKIDIIHTFNFRGISILSSLAIKSSKIPHIHTLQDVQLIRPCMSKNWRMKTFLCKFYSEIYSEIIGSPDIIISPSKFALKEHISRGFFKDSKYYILPNPSRVPFINKSYSKKNNFFNILFVGGITRGKGVYILLDAFKELNKKQANLHFVGTGPELENLIKYAQDSANVFIHGYVSEEDLISMYSKANVTVVPSIIYDNFPSTIIESFSCGTPVIGSKIGGISESIEDGLNGKLFEAGNVMALKDILEYLFYNPQELERMGNEALESAKKYRPEDHIQKLLDIYQSLFK
jgi:glycosyltransferase involved in cell wall biosynthesis